MTDLSTILKRPIIGRAYDIWYGLSDLSPQKEEAYRRRWCQKAGVSLKEIRAKFGQHDPMACVHRGEEIRLEKCQLCGTENRSESVYACSVHGECTLSRFKSGKSPVCCLGCPDQKERLTFADKFHQASQSIPEPPAFEGRGIVICAGGWRFFPSVWVTVQLIRESGCNLPIEIWHLDKKEKHPLMEWLLRDSNVKWRNAQSFQRKNPEWRFRNPDPQNLGWALKSLAAAASSFEEVLFFDADCYPIDNPEYVFETTYYQKKGAVFFPDIASKSNLPWKRFGLEPRKEHEWESGQFVVNKAVHWESIWLAFWLNSHSRVTYKHIYGDKDTFHIAWRKTKARVALHKDAPMWRNIAFIHRTPEGKPYSVHRCRDKFRFTTQDNSYRTPQRFKQPRPTRGLPRERQAHKSYLDLKRHWRKSLLIVGESEEAVNQAQQKVASLTNLLPVHVLSSANNWHYPPYSKGSSAYESAVLRLKEFPKGSCIADWNQPYLIVRYLLRHPNQFKVLHIVGGDHSRLLSAYSDRSIHDLSRIETALSEMGYAS